MATSWPKTRALKSLWTSSWTWFTFKVNCILRSITKNAVSSFRGIILPPLFGTSESAFEVLRLAWLPVSRKTLAHSSEKSRGWARWPRTSKTWWMRTGWGNEICFALTEEVSRESLLLSATTWMDGARLLPEVYSYGMWGSRHKLEQGKWQLDIGKKMVLPLSFSSPETGCP